MIRRMSHASVFVTNQDEALKFYLEKLGFEVRTDAKVGEDFRWLTVGPKDQPDFELILMEPKPGMLMDEETVGQIRALVDKGVLGGGVFETRNCQKSYEELKARGVEFLAPPMEQSWGIGAVFKDNSGNWFSLSQEKE